MVFHPPRRTGLMVGLGASLLLLALDAALVAVWRSAPLSLLGFAALVLLLASLPALALLAYRTYSLWRSRYVLSRNALVVEWGGRRLVLPLGMVAEARPGGEVDADLRPRGLWWPGAVVGRANLDPLGEVEFLAAADRAGLVLLRHPYGWLALSPEDPPAFLNALAACQAEGVADEVEPEAVEPAFFQWALWHDRAALALLAAGGLGALLLLGYLAAIAPQLPPTLALHFNAEGVPDRFGPPSGLLILPLIGGLAWLVNSALGLWLHRQPAERPAAYLLLGAGVFVQALTWVAAVGLLTAGNAG